jgi:hypothetical protein
MNEERQEAYQNLIQTLLSCPADNVAAILPTFRTPTVTWGAGGL